MAGAIAFSRLAAYWLISGPGMMGAATGQEFAGFCGVVAGGCWEKQKVLANRMGRNFRTTEE